ncbi:hypothetical protein Q73_06505 [Bacillus coahuilensis m2-6]|uniref:cytochrome c biogenesis CcdA family protein n=1 Tax=Bacillus coahuilensis TaxID=408580 RepID=UPI0007504E09|nr:cytochrome c biogenesis protein CcdA [Bacillus coahuilensis]KUP08386.1 hypothetical protein Q73_06505 [Bacillus coahuilensis m2-6]
MENVSIIVALGAGFLSFISPCCLPLYPAFLSYITGMSIQELKDENPMLKKNSLLHTLFFLSGFSIIFIALGFSTSFIGRVFIENQDFIRQIGGIIIVVFGLVIVGVFTPGFLMKDRRIEFKNRPSGYFGSVLIGLAFAAGWTPCTGPILGTVIALAVENPELSSVYMFSYFLGFAIPFILLSFFVGHMKVIKRHSQKLVKIGGYIMIAFGILLFFDLFTTVISYLTTLTGGFQGF